MNRGGIITGLLLKVVILVVLVGVGVYFTLDYIVEFGIEGCGTWILGTRVSVSSVDIDILAGQGSINGLKVNDPTGFSKGAALEVKEVAFRLDLNSLSASPVIIDQVLVDGPEVNYMQNESGSSNVDAIMNHLDRFLNKRLEKTEAKQSAKNAVIRQFTVKRGTLAVKSGDIPGKLQIVKLPTITLNNVGGKDGSSVAQLGHTIASTFSRAIVKTASGRGVESYLELVLTDKVVNPAKSFVKKVF